MKTINKLFFTKKEAWDYAMELIEDDGGFVPYRPVSVNLSGFETPDELDAVSGETNAFCVYDASDNVIAYIAYWQE